MDVNAFIKKNGFIWGPEPEIYGGVAGFYTYGPLGKLLKDKVENAIRTVFKQNGFWEVEAPFPAAFCIHSYCLPRIPGRIIGTVLI